MDIAMTETIRPWSIYEARLSAGSAGRIPLEMAFAMLVSDRVGVEAYELLDIFSAPSDDGDNDIMRELVRLEAELMSEEILNGNLSTFARPIGGGGIIALKPDIWEIDEPLDRFAVAALNIEHWMDAQAQPTHRIFVGEEQFKKWASDLLRPESFGVEDVDQIFDPFGHDLKLSAQNAAMDQHGDSNPSSNQTISSDPPGVGPKLLKLPAVKEMVSLSRSSIYGKIAEKTFPEQSKIGGGSFWLESEIVQWIKENAYKSRA